MRPVVSLIPPSLSGRRRILSASLLSLPLAGIAIPSHARPPGGGRFNIIGRSDKIEGGKGLIAVKGGGQEVYQVEVSISGGPLTLTKVLVHFADPKLKPWPNAIKPRTDVEWTSNPIKWPSGKPHMVISVAFWYTGTPGKNARIDLLGLQ